ncbi:MAG: hypothetical protein LBP22_13970 [Deltaproteobacteria bacterium]|jgi:hypothetical protein|nr:hypothetical protein [Deltaproteobacteria bacterium]
MIRSKEIRKWVPRLTEVHFFQTALTEPDSPGTALRPARCARPEISQKTKITVDKPYFLLKKKSIFMA